MNNCGNCKFWTGETEYKKYRICMKVVEAGPMFGEDPETIDLGVLPAFTEDGSGFQANLITLPTFSCSLHKVKDD